VDKKLSAKKLQSSEAKPTLHRKADVKRFDKAAKTFTGRATVSQNAARKTLVALGINTKTGKLTKRYR
jgi:hypothetical protein